MSSPWKPSRRHSEYGMVIGNASCTRISFKFYDVSPPVSIPLISGMYVDSLKSSLLMDKDDGNPTVDPNAGGGVVGGGRGTRGLWGEAERGDLEALVMALSPGGSGDIHARTEDGELRAEIFVLGSSDFDALRNAATVKNILCILYLYPYGYMYCEIYHVCGFAPLSPLPWKVISCPSFCVF